MDAEARGLTATDLADRDALLIYHTQKEPDAATRTALSEWVGAGKPLLILHAGLGAWPEWPDFAAWCGKTWDWGVSQHPHEPARLAITSGNPFGFDWTEAWLPKDEVFVKLRDSGEIRTGLSVEISTGTFAAAWQNQRFPNVGVWMPGHRRDSWKVPAMREGAAKLLKLLWKAETS